MRKDLKSATSVKTGKKFLDFRKKLELTIDDVASKLFVNKEYISAIETGNYSIFPSEAFAKAYFKKYKNFLKIDCDFPDLFTELNSKKFKKIKTEIKLSYSLNKKTQRKIVIAVMIIIFISFLFVFSKISQKNIDLREDIYQISDIENYMLIEEMVSNNFPILEPLEIEIIDNNLIELSFTDSCWIELYINDYLVEAQQFDSGDIYTKVVKMPFKIVVGNADSVKGTYNGEVIDFTKNANELNGVNTIIFNND